jgi:hypothetical protein
LPGTNNLAFYEHFVNDRWKKFYKICPWRCILPETEKRLRIKKNCKFLTLKMVWRNRRLSIQKIRNCFDKKNNNQKILDLAKKLARYKCSSLGTISISDKEESFITLTSGVKVRFLSSSMTLLLNKLECFVLSKFFQASVIFVGKARACQSEAP